MLGYNSELCVFYWLSPPSVRLPLAPEDEELLRDEEAATPVKKDGIKRKERPTDKGVAWLVKTQYISPLSMESTKQVVDQRTILTRTSFLKDNRKNCVLTDH